MNRSGTARILHPWRCRILQLALTLGLFCLATASAREIPLTILNTTDLHGSITDNNGRYPGKYEGSLLRVASLIGDIRREAPNVLLLDGGDIFQGTAESHSTTGRIMSTAMNTLGYDAFAVGNHEFDWGVETLGKFLNSQQAVPLAANIRTGPRTPEGVTRIKPYIIKEIDGLRVGIVGLTTPNLHNWFRGLADYDIRVSPSVRILEKLLPEIRQKNPHILILLVHQGLLANDDDANEIRAICNRFGEFDVILGGHLHYVLPGAKIGRADYAQAGSDARGLLRIDLTYDTVAGRTTSKQIQFIPVTPDIPEAADIKALVEKDLQKADGAMSTRLGHAETDLTASHAMPGLSPSQQLLCRAIADATEAEVVIHGLLSSETLPAGPLHVADIWRLVPYENTIGTAWLQLADLYAIMEEAAGFIGTERYVGTFGIQYELYPNAPRGKRVRNIRAADGSAINGKRRIKTAFNSYHLAGGGGRFPILVKTVNKPHARLQMDEVLARDMVADYIRRHKTIQIPAGTNATVIRKEPSRWQRRGK